MEEGSSVSSDLGNSWVVLNTPNPVHEGKEEKDEKKQEHHHPESDSDSISVISESGCSIASKSDEEGEEDVAKKEETEKEENENIKTEESEMQVENVEMQEEDQEEEDDDEDDDEMNESLSSDESLSCDSQMSSQSNTESLIYFRRHSTFFLNAIVVVLLGILILKLEHYFFQSFFEIEDDHQLPFDIIFHKEDNCKFGKYVQNGREYCYSEKIYNAAKQNPNKPKINFIKNDTNKFEDLTKDENSFKNKKKYNNKFNSGLMDDKKKTDEYISNMDKLLDDLDYSNMNDNDKFKKLKKVEKYLKRKEKSLIDFEHRLLQREIKLVQEELKENKKAEKGNYKKNRFKNYHKHPQKDEMKDQKIKNAEKIKNTEKIKKCKPKAFDGKNKKKFSENRYKIKHNDKGNITGDWYCKWHEARKNYRKKEHESDWLFERAKLRSNKRNKARWYFQLMFDRERLRSK